MASAMDIERPTSQAVKNVPGKSGGWKTSSGLSLSPPLRISTSIIKNQEQRMKDMSVSDLGEFPRFRYERDAEDHTQPMMDDELDMDLADPVDDVGEGRDAHCFKSFFDCCRGMRT